MGLLQYDLTKLGEAVEDRRAWRALVHVVTKSRTRLNDDDNRLACKVFINHNQLFELCLETDWLPV